MKKEDGWKKKTVVVIIITIVCKIVPIIKDLKIIPINRPAGCYVN